MEIHLTSVIVMLCYLENVDLKRAARSEVRVQLLSKIDTEKVAGTTGNNTNNIA